MKNNRDFPLRTAGAAAVIAVLLLVLSILGNVRISGYLKASMEESIHQVESEIASKEVQESIEESKMEETAVHEIALTYTEEQLLNLLEGKMHANDLEGAARVLNENDTAFQDLFFEKLADETCLYIPVNDSEGGLPHSSTVDAQGDDPHTGGVMKDEADGHGLVFQRAGTIFYGDFKDGKPSGQCVALQAITLDEGVRYDYSVGTWTDGVMNGAGECGYDYYEGVTGDGAKKTVKKGNFADDLMEGEITYTSVNGNGESTSWTMTVENGVIVPDARWISDTSDDGTPVFRLMADTDDVHAYVVEADAMEEVRWKNMIEWGE
ncbi:hypothetical protein DFR60_12051 [Hungatella effluvii]|uniref:Uncharacterized protein n=1 Tax=Hungatella effluvii TaxID=1096246 RepID=A0A2V3XVI2_9FIRM|nr:hypothetical protein [Hungatella effluvii]PXX46412.1 hypothetical protein DFR60_12051 [Hungatella effluvii]